MEKNFHYTYLIYCTEPTSIMYGCIYYGKHSTNNLLDGYITSGKKIKRYIKKYPNGYYRKILHLYNSEDELNKAEYELIEPHLGKSYCLNLKHGGDRGGWSIEHKSIKHRRNISKSLTGRIISESTKRNMSLHHADISGKNNPMYGKNPRDYMTEEAKKARDKKQSDSIKGEKNGMYGKGYKIKGENNPAYGRKWMTNGLSVIYPKPEEFQKYIDMGYHFGKK